MLPMFPSQACWNQLPSINLTNLTAFLRLFESVLQALPSLYMPAHMTFCTTCTSKENNIDVTSMNRGEEEMLQIMGTDGSFRTFASLLSDFR